MYGALNLQLQISQHSLSERGVKRFYARRFIITSAGPAYKQDLHWAVDTVSNEKPEDIRSSRLSRYGRLRLQPTIELLF